MKYIKKVLGSLRKADNDYGLIENGDRICVGISGGKDSTTLLYCLKLYQMFSKKEYQLIPIYCDMGFSKHNIEPLQQYVSSLGLKLIVFPTEISEILKLNLDKNGRQSCSLCSRLRKGAIINAAKQYNCNKLAFGHHNDDAVETLFMNMIHGGRIATFKPLTYLERSDITLIRPLIYSYESDIINVAKYLDFPIIKSGCYNDGNSERAEMKQLLNQFYHKYKCKDNFSLMLRNYTKVELFKPVNVDEKNDFE
ncbi:MAG: tRNA 2-thiocytidine biosynthesis TtcA family protein [Erysipelotrichaceae bacterium]